MNPDQTSFVRKVNCDPATGLCALPDYDQKTVPIVWKEGEEIIYIGDPMCSWCWGISPELNALNSYAAHHSIPFSIVMGGLRPGGGQIWDTEFKAFLKHHWQEVNKRSGQPFGYELLKLDNFNYDTEPACRATVTARHISPEKTLSFYELVQHYFYVQSQDPNDTSFYKPICSQLSTDFDRFCKLFISEEMKYETAKDFAQSRQWGVQAFPTVVYRKDEKLYLIAQGYARFEELKRRIEETYSGN